jgi:hypothetical protein
MIDAELLRNNTLFRLSSTAWGNTRKVALSDDALCKIVGLSDTDRETPEGAAKLKEASKRLNGSKTLVACPQYQAIKDFMATSKQEVLRRYCNPSFLDRGLYTVKNELVPEVAQLVDSLQPQIDVLVTDFLAVYRAQKELDRGILNGQFRESDYPPESDVEKRFRVTYRFIQFSVPEGLPPEIRAQEEEKLRKAYADAQAAIVSALWSEFSELIDHIVDRLAPSENGSRKKWNNTLLEGIAEFTTAFGNRNAFNDERLAGLVAKADAILKAASRGSDIKTAAEWMRDYPKLREEASTAFRGLKDEVEKAVSEEPIRKFDFSEE